MEKDIVFITCSILFIYLFIFMNKKNLLYIKDNNGEGFYIINGTYKKEKEILMNQIINNLYKLKEYLVTIESEEFRPYLKQLNKNFNKNTTMITETDPSETDVTSYTVNKGSEISFCLVSKKTNKVHDINTLMYVAIHELSHVANHEIGHGPLFQKIFKFFLEEAIKLNIYKMEDYNNKPVEYCGININSNILL